MASLGLERTCRMGEPRRLIGIVRRSLSKTLAEATRDAARVVTPTPQLVSAALDRRLTSTMTPVPISATRMVRW
jgi:hypothetical protein